MSEQGRPPDREAANIAAGSAVVLLGGVAERALRMVLGWWLARGLGAVGFGVVSFAQTVVGTVVSLSALGTDAGIVYFGARYRKAGEQERLKGTLLACLGIGLLTGLLATLLTGLVGLLASGDGEQALALRGLRIGALSVGFGTALAVLVGGLVAARDMRGQALTSQIGLPLFTLLLSGLLLVSGFGVEGALWAMALGYALATGWAARLFWARFGALLREPAVRPAFEHGKLLRYSLPQALARSLYQANLRIDILMLTALSTLTEVGVYKVATMIAMFGSLPVMASTTMFGPVVSELVYGRQIERLQGLLRVVTRWLLILSTPLYLGLLLLPDLLLGLFDPEFQQGGRALAILLLGQAVYLAGAPTGALITMGGYSGTNMVNGLVSVGLNVVLNALFIPRLGMEGAALASALSVVLWTTLRAVQVRILLGCTALDRRVLGVVGLSVLCGALGAVLGEGQALLVRLGLVGLMGLLFLLGIAAMGRTAEDEELLRRMRAKLRR